MKIKFFILFFLGAVLLCTCNKEKGKFDGIGLPNDHQQIILVTTDTWESLTGTMTLWDMDNGLWVNIDSTIDVVVGKNGLGWGRGIHTTTSGVEKEEGDGKAPAGIFEIGYLFGYSESAPAGTKMNYRGITHRDYFIDDINSEDYNLWKFIPSEKENFPKDYWESYERMNRKDHLYELGFVVLHNVAPVVKGKGSAIFFHVWRGEGLPTVGCTAMSKENIEKLMIWLDSSKKPLIVQVPKGQIENLKFKDNK